MNTPAEDLAFKARQIADNFQVELPRLLEHVASLGGMDQYCQPGDLIGPAEFLDEVTGFCRREVLNRLPPEQRDAISNMAQRVNYVNWRDWQEKRAWPYLRTRGHLRVDFDHVISKALGVPSVNYLHKFKGNSDDAMKALIVYVEKERGVTVTKDEYEGRREKITTHIRATWERLGVTSPHKQSSYIRSWLKATLPEVISSNEPVEAIIAQFDEGAKKLEEQLNELRAHGLTGEEQTTGEKKAPAAPPAQEDLFNQDLLNDSEAKLQNLPKTPATNQHGQGEAKEAPAATSTPETPVTPQEPAAANESGATEAVEEKADIPTVLFVNEDKLLGDLEYHLEARWEKAELDIWVAKVTTKERATDERAKDLRRYVETFLQTKQDVEVVIDIFYEPSVPEINDLRDAAQKMIKELFPDDTKEQQAEHFKTGTGHEKAVDALKVETKDEALKRLHEYLMKVHEQRKAEQASEKSLSLLPRTEIVVDQQPTNVIPMPAFGFRLPTLAEMQFIEFMSKRVVKSGFYPAIKTEDQAVMVMVKGYTLGIDPMSSLDGIEPIIDKNGRITMSFRSKLLKALVERTGQCLRFDVVVDDHKAVATVQRKGREVHTFTFSLEDAKAAKLTDKFVWQSHTKKMLMWRVISQAVDIDFPEVRYVFTENAPDDEEAA